MAAGDDISLTYAGGQLGEVYQRVSDMPRFEVGERYLVFAYYDGTPHANPLVGGPQGLFKITSDEITGRQYPVKLSGRGITSLQNGKFNFAPRLKRIAKGLLEFAEDESYVKIKKEPPVSPEGWPFVAKTRKPGLPKKVLSLDELTAKIDATLAQEPPAAVVEKLAVRAISALQEQPRRSFNSEKPDRAWEFSDAGQLIILDPSRVTCRTAEKKVGTAVAARKSSATGFEQPLGKISYGDVIVSGWMDLPLIMEMVPE